VGAAVDALTAAGCASPRLDAELMLADAMGVDRTLVIADPSRAIEPRAARLAGERIRRRVMREPVAYILGRQAFRHIELHVDSRVLIPRPETELLVEVALDLPEGARVHDVGTGSGAIALAIKHERPDLVVSGSDASPEAVEVARSNAHRLGLDVEFEVAEGLTESRAQSPDSRTLDAGHLALDSLVVANLPYVREDEWPSLQPEIRLYEPRVALVSGQDGLGAIRSLVAQAPAGTRLALEHAPGQAADVRALLDRATTFRDLAGRDRMTLGSAL
jgi:release factor glutamine methyltransferase